ncbi:MAG TPA: permease prefix domain 2-containing transporter, partial [Cyclobacteriaceae bacterium]|nr:permease prefix domain 2-containing transporter [Cyclobacteriaceae bacterium]
MGTLKVSPPQFALKFFRWYCHPKMCSYIEGDLLEVYERRVIQTGKRKADLKFIIDVLLLLRPGIIRPMEGYKNLNTYGMFRSYFKIGWRNLMKKKGYSFINIGGLATGMAVVILIGLWVRDELTFNTDFENYGRIAQVWQFVKFDAEKSSYNTLPIPLAGELREKYPDFESVSLSTARENILSTDTKTFLKSGNYVEPSFI